MFFGSCCCNPPVTAPSCGCGCGCPNYGCGLESIIGAIVYLSILQNILCCGPGIGNIL